MARKTTTIVRCDNPTCKNLGEVEDLKLTPEGWYRIGQADARGTVTMTVGTFDLCSIRCVEKWAKERRVALDGLAEQNGHREDNMELVLMCLEEGRTTSREIQAETGLAQNTVDRWLSQLVDVGLAAITHEGSGSKTHPRRYESRRAHD